MVFSISFILCSSCTASACFFSAWRSESWETTRFGQMRNLCVCVCKCERQSYNHAHLFIPELCGTSAHWESWLGQAGAVGLPACPVSHAYPSPAVSWPPPSPASSPPAAPVHAPAPNTQGSQIQLELSQNPKTLGVECWFSLSWRSLILDLANALFLLVLLPHHIVHLIQALSSLFVCLQLCLAVLKHCLKNKNMAFFIPS